MSCVSCGMKISDHAPVAAALLCRPAREISCNTKLLVCNQRIINNTRNWYILLRNTYPSLPNSHTKFLRSISEQRITKQSALTDEEQSIQLWIFTAKSMRSPVEAWAQVVYEPLSRILLPNLPRIRASLLEVRLLCL